MAWEVKKVYQPIKIEAVDLREGRITVKNKYDFLPLIDLALEWSLDPETATVNKGTIDLHLIQAGESEQFVLPYDFPALPFDQEIILNLSVTTKTARNFLPSGHEIAKEQFIIRTPTKLIETEWFPFFPPTRASHDGESPIQIHVNEETGLLQNVLFRGVPLFQHPISPYFWRAPLDNDFGWGMPEKCAPWRYAHQQLQLTDFNRSANGNLVAQFRLAHLPVRLTICYSLTANGSLSIKTTFIPETEELPPLPRLGLHTCLTDFTDQLSYFGRGPFENYPDRKFAAHLGKYKLPLSELSEYYISPQECGNREDVRWVHFSGNNGLNLAISGAAPGFGLTATPYTPEELTRKTRGSLHPIDLPESQGTSLCIDHAQMGLGGIDSWLSPPLDQYLIPIVETEFVFFFQFWEEYP
ncbi:MAG: beta-galactosidase domain 4-containing protein [Bacteroidota bacterium]